MIKFVAAIILVCMSGPLSAHESSFDGGKIDYLIGSKPNGGYDRYARLIAPVMAEKLGGVDVVPVNKPAGAGLPALNRFSNAKSDGRMMMTFNTGHLISYIIDPEAFDVEMESLAYIGKASSETRVLIVRTDLDAQNIDDLTRTGEPFKFTSSGKGGASYVQLAMLKKVFGLNIRILPGFSGGERRAALAKGETDGYLTSEGNLPRILEGGFGRPILRFGPASLAELEDVPNALEPDSKRRQI